MILFDRFLAVAVDSTGTGSTSFRGGLRSPAGIHLRGPARRLILRRFPAVRGGLRPGVASQKISPDASDMPRFARQHTKCTGRNHEINGLAGSGESFYGQPVTACPKKPSLASVRRTLAEGQAVGNCPSRNPATIPIPITVGPWQDSRLDPGSQCGIHQSERGEQALRRTLPIMMFS